MLYNVGNDKVSDVKLFFFITFNIKKYLRNIFIFFVDFSDKKTKFAV